MDNTLLYITDWKEYTAARGRSAGTILKSRLLVQYDKRNYVICEQQENKESGQGINFTTQLVHAIDSAWRLGDKLRSRQDMFNEMIVNLNKITKKKFVYDPSLSLAANCKAADIYYQFFGE